MHRPLGYATMTDAEENALYALKYAHSHSYNNKSEIEKSSSCRCFHCLGEFPVSAIHEFVGWSGPRKLHGYVGLTGGIASGKSTVGKYLREFGISVVDADEISKEVVAPGTPGLQEVVSVFGADFLKEDGCLDRQKLGALVFSDPAKMLELEAILHPLIDKEARFRLRQILGRGEWVAVYEAAIMVEHSLHEKMDHLVVVAVSEDVQVSRLMARNGLTESEARQRIAAQYPLEKKLEKAHIVLWNNGSSDELREQVRVLVQDGVLISEETAICPKCGIDSVVGDASGIEMTPDFFRAMHQWWFGTLYNLDGTPYLKS